MNRIEIRLLQLLNGRNRPFWTFRNANILTVTVLLATTIFILLHEPSMTTLRNVPGWQHAASLVITSFVLWYVWKRREKQEFRSPIVALYTMALVGGSLTMRNLILLLFLG
jgi:hypothetical protein